MRDILCVAFPTLLIYLILVLILMSSGFPIHGIMGNKPDLAAQVLMTIEQNLMAQCSNDSDDRRRRSAAIGLSPQVTTRAELHACVGRLMTMPIRIHPQLLSLRLF